MHSALLWITAAVVAIVVLPLFIYIISRVQMAAWLSAMQEFINQQQEKSNEKKNK
jgi:hypothetical protein